MQTRLTLRPGQSGTGKLVERFGERLGIAERVANNDHVLRTIRP